MLLLSGPSRKVRYSLYSGDINTLSIDPYNGIVRLIRPIKREETEVLSAVIAATDQGEPPRTSTAQLTVYISDINDPPVFERRV